MCKLANGVVGTFALRWFMESFNEAANFKFECPSLKVITRRNFIYEIFIENNLKF